MEAKGKSFLRPSVLNWGGVARTPRGCVKGLDGVREGINVSDDNTKNNTSNGARGAKKILPSGRGGLQNELRTADLYGATGRIIGNRLVVDE